MTATDATAKLQAALDELNALGSVEAIARHLITVGVSGYVADSCRCPLAYYLTRRLGQAVQVGLHHAGVVAPDAGLMQLVRLPDYVRWFRDRFDGGGHRHGIHWEVLTPADAPAGWEPLHTLGCPLAEGR